MNFMYTLWLTTHPPISKNITDRELNKIAAKMPSDTNNGSSFSYVLVVGTSLVVVNNSNGLGIELILSI